MFFSRTYRYQSSSSEHDIRNRLLGKHLKVHDLDFEVFEKERVLTIVPNTDNVTGPKTLPVTEVSFKDNNNKTHICIHAKMRATDVGGPRLVVLFCALLLLTAILFFVFGCEEFAVFAYTLTGICLAIFVVFWLRMESGFFDYIRKVRDYVRLAGKDD